jgi:AcrR family transcriptional regulator
VFAKKGAREATVEDLLEAAELSRRTFYLAFRNKEEVLAALYEIACKLVYSALKQAAESAAQPLHRLESCVDAFLAFNRTQPDLMRVLEGEALRADSLLGPLRAELLDRLGEVLSKAAGGKRDPLVVRGVLVGLEAISQRIHAEGPPTEARIARARKAMLRILISSLL